MDNSHKPIASVSLDLDNQWSYMKTHGEKGWEKFPTYLDWAVPRILDFLQARDQKITFFIVGQDAELECNADAMKAIGDSGHEVGNHSFNHEPWLHLYDQPQLEGEMEAAETAIEKATGQKPVGFRGPGFSLSPTTLRVLSDRGYKYDATVFPNLLNPLARAYFFSTSSLSKEEKEQRKELFGTWRDALRPVKPFEWEFNERTLLELPVTTMPIFKVPIHLSYVLYASRYSQFLAKMYFRFSMLMCRLTNTSPSLLLHPLDFIGHEDVADLGFFPGMDMPKDTKIGLVSWVLDEMEKHYRLTTVAEHASATGDSLRRLELTTAPNQ